MTPRAALLLGFLGMVGCSRPPAPPVAVSCVPDSLGAAPTYPDEDAALLAAPDAAARYRLLALGREARAWRLGELEGVVQVCRHAGDITHGR